MKYIKLLLILPLLLLAACDKTEDNNKLEKASFFGLSETSSYTVTSEFTYYGWESDVSLLIERDEDYLHVDYYHVRKTGNNWYEYYQDLGSMEITVIDEHGTSDRSKEDFIDRYTYDLREWTEDMFVKSITDYDYEMLEEFYTYIPLGDLERVRQVYINVLDEGFMIHVDYISGSYWVFYEMTISNIDSTVVVIPID